MDLKVEQRPASANSDSSLEPMETSSSNKTGISEANSSIAVKTTNDSDNIESDDNTEESSYQIRKKHEINNSLRRKNVRLCVDDILKRFLPSSNSTNNSVTMKKSNSYHNKNESSNNATSSPNHNNNHHVEEEDMMEDEQRLNSSGNNNTNKSSDMKIVKYVCPICDVISTTPHEFTAHIRGHNNDSSDDNQNYTCRICSKVSLLSWFELIKELVEKILVNKLGLSAI